MASSAFPQIGQTNHTGTLNCRVCGEGMRHALLRDACLAEHRDYAETPTPQSYFGALETVSPNPAANARRALAAAVLTAVALTDRCAVRRKMGRHTVVGDLHSVCANAQR